MDRHSDNLLAWVLNWTALTTLVFWLPTVRVLFDGPSYSWGLFGFGGAGFTVDYLVPVSGSFAALLIQWLGSRGGRRLLLYLLLGLWHLSLAAGAVYFAATRPGTFRFQGDTLGLDFSLAVVGPALFSAWAIATLVWIVRDLRATGADASGRNTSDLRWAAVLVGLLPAQFFLLRFGAPDGLTDQVGVLLTVAQWLLVGPALRTRRGSVP